MEGEKLFGQWQHQGEAAMSEMGSTLSISEHRLQHPGLLHVNWDQSMDQSSHFESAMSSIVSSPTNHTAPRGESVAIHELIGRLGSICNAGEISPQSRRFGNPNGPSCYSTPLNSPPKLNLSMMEHHQLAQRNLPISGNLVPSAHLASFTADPEFAERAARFTAFGGRSYSQVMLQDAGKLSRASSSKSMMGSVPSTPEDVREESSVSGAEARESNGRKRKAGQKGKGNSLSKDLPKVVEEEDSVGKKLKPLEGVIKGNDEIKLKEELSGNDDDSKPGKESCLKPPEPPKQDYIHVRARRGQATDSHSLAERVRREKISERMKFLQNIVPGCNKVTGKAVMLDEIINYVQSLQRQVEFLSMKLATLNPQLDFNIDDLIQKDMLLQRGGSMPHPVFPVETHMPPLAFPFPQQPSHDSPLQSIVTAGMEGHCALNPMDIGLRLPYDGVADAAPQIGALWEDDLHSFVQMAYGQNQELPFSSQPFHGSLPTTHMKVEL